MLKLGGIMGDCNLCEGSGKILERDLPKPIKRVQETPSFQVVEQVAQSLPHSKSDPVTVEAVTQNPQSVEDTLSITRRKAVYKHKRG